MPETIPVQLRNDQLDVLVKEYRLGAQKRTDNHAVLDVDVLLSALSYVIESDMSTEEFEKRIATFGDAK